MLWGGKLISVLIFGIIGVILSIQIYCWQRKNSKRMKIMQKLADAKMERIKRIKDLLKPFFDQNGEEFVNATEQQILDFVEKCKQKNVPVSVWEQLVEFYGVTNGVPCLNGFDFHA
jgi:hypothetical protein